MGSVNGDLLYRCLTLYGSQKINMGIPWHYIEVVKENNKDNVILCCFY